jgi:hypothetical protein
MESEKKEENAMFNDKLEPTSPENQAEGGSGCGPGCNCGGAKIGTKTKMIICLVVAIAAAIVLANSIMQKAETGTDRGLSGFTAKAQLAENASPQTDKVDPSLWDKPLESIASLNEVASQKDAIFLYLPAKGQSPDESVKKEIEAAAGKAQLQGTKMAFFVLDEGSPDYVQVTSQVSAPCVLAMVYGTGKSAATTNISEANLLQSLVEASRPSSCSPGGCAVPC